MSGFTSEDVVRVFDMTVTHHCDVDPEFLQKLHFDLGKLTNTHKQTTVYMFFEREITLLMYCDLKFRFMPIALSTQSFARFDVSPIHLKNTSYTLILTPESNLCSSPCELLCFHILHLTDCSSLLKIRIQTPARFIYHDCYYKHTLHATMASENQCSHYLKRSVRCLPLLI